MKIKDLLFLWIGLICKYRWLKISSIPVLNNSPALCFFFSKGKKKLKTQRVFFFTNLLIYSFNKYLLRGSLKALKECKMSISVFWKRSQLIKRYKYINKNNTRIKILKIEIKYSEVFKEVKWFVTRWWRRWTIHRRFHGGTSVQAGPLTMARNSGLWLHREEYFEEEAFQSKGKRTDRAVSLPWDFSPCTSGAV